MVVNQQSVQLETGAILVGELEDYSIYFLTSRGRIRLAPRQTCHGLTYLENYRNEDGQACCSMLLTVDVPRGFSPMQVNATLTVTSELERLLRLGVADPDAKLVGITMPPEADFPNALTFVFKNKGEQEFSLSTNITPSLTNFITIDEPSERGEFGRYLAYNIHYIGQTATTLEDRLHAHEKIRMLADRLLTKELDQEPVIFAYTFSGGETLDRALALDLVEAALIAHFKPTLNIDKRCFPSGTSPTEVSLRKRLNAEKITQVDIASIGYLNRRPPDPDQVGVLADGFGFTRDDTGNIRALSNQSISINIE
ncbi:hypothetical protein BCO18430_06033 [Burkholderia contaminans]|nr:hypothetical protein BCO18430_06033 [Burkholderia contaminans]